MLTDIMDIHSSVTVMSSHNKKGQEKGDTSRASSSSKPVEIRSNVVTRSAKKNVSVKDETVIPLFHEVKFLHQTARSGGNDTVAREDLGERLPEVMAKNGSSTNTKIKVEPDTRQNDFNRSEQALDYNRKQNESFERLQDGFAEMNPARSQERELVDSEDLRQKKMVDSYTCTDQMSGTQIQQGENKMADASTKQSGYSIEYPSTGIPTNTIEYLEKDNEKEINLYDRNEVVRKDVHEENAAYANREMRGNMHDIEDEIRRVQLTRILESSGSPQNTFAHSKIETKLANGPDDSSKINVSENSSSVADDTEGPGMNVCSKSYFMQSDESVYRDLDAEGIKVTLTANTLAAGGDAGMVSAIPHFDKTIEACGEFAPEFSHVDQILKREPKEGACPGGSEKKDEATFDMDPSLIPIKPIPALPYLPPDPSMMYQPEAGVMKSKPVPKPTRGRRARRRSSSGISTEMGLPRHYFHHPDMQMVEDARCIPRRQYQPYALHETPAGPPRPCYSLPRGHGSAYNAFLSDPARDMIGTNGMGGMANVSSSYPNSRWYCGEDHFKVPRTNWCARRVRGSSGGRGRPRGRRGSGGVRQYLQHRLLWARYTGRSQEALDRVLTIINSRCGLKEDGTKESSTKLWNMREPVDEVAEGGYLAEARMDDYEHPCHEPGRMDPESLNYNRGVFSSNISNMMTGGSNSCSILSQSGIGSNAVVDGNGYIVYLNQEDSTDYHHPAVPFVPAEGQVSDRGAPASVIPQRRPAPVHNSDALKDNELRREGMTLPLQTYSSKYVSSNVALQAKTADSETSVMAGSVPQEGQCTPTGKDRYLEENGETGRRITEQSTPKNSGLKTPVKEPKAAIKRPVQASGSKQKKKVRRSLSFSSPIKQDETLMATENIANAMTSTTSENEPVSGNHSNYTMITSAPLPSISNLLHTGTSSGISINIHVTNDVNKDRSGTTTHAGGEDVMSASRVCKSTCEPTKGAPVRAEAFSNRPVEALSAAPTPVHYPIPRYTVEWHNDYQHPVEIDRSRRYQHMMPTPGNPGGSRFRYPYRDANSSLGYYTQQRPFSAFSTPMDRYYTSEYAKEWPEVYPKYPPEHYLSNYDVQHPPAVSPIYPSTHWNPGWGTNPEIIMDARQKAVNSRVGLDMDGMQDVPYPYCPKSVPYPRSDHPNFPDEISQERPCYTSFDALPLNNQYTGQMHGAVPDNVPDSRQPKVGYDASYGLHHPCLVPDSCTQEAHVLEGHVNELNPTSSSQSQLPSQMRSSIQDPSHMQTEDQNQPKE